MFLQRTMLFMTATAMVSALGCNSNSGPSTGSAAMETKVDSVSYSLGYQNAMILKQNNMQDLNLELLYAGMKEGLQDSADPAVPERQMRTIIQSYQMEKRQQAMQQQQEEGKANNRKGQEFLAENASKEGVMETESGLQYKVLTEGDGPSPTSTDSVVVHYSGTLLDGTQFDSSYERGEPAEFRLSGVIEGWTEGLQLMNQGGKYQFWIPSELAYGNNPPPGSPIKPGQTLVFEVELLEVK